MGIRLAPEPQLSMFAERAPQGSKIRVELDATSWIEHVVRWLPDPEPLFTELAALASWQQRSRWMFTRTVVEPRLTAEIASMGEAPTRLQALAQRLSHEYGVSYVGLWMNLYRDHQDGTGWHGDRLDGVRQEAIVPVLSLGATRRFSIRPRDGGRSKTFVVASGDLVVMGGRCQKDWVHAVPRETTPTGPRISVNFQGDRGARLPSDC